MGEIYWGKIRTVFELQLYIAQSCGLPPSEYPNLFYNGIGRGVDTQKEADGYIGNAIVDTQNGGNLLGQNSNRFRITAMYRPELRSASF